MFGLFQSYKASVRPYTFTINTALGNGSATFVLPLSTIRMQNFLIDWGDGLTEIYAGLGPSLSHTYSTGGTYTIRIYPRDNGYQSIGWNNATDAPKLVRVDSWGNSRFQTLATAFYGCANLTTLPENVPIVQLLSLSNTFRGCSSLTRIPVMDTTQCTTIVSALFQSVIKQNLSWLRIDTCTTATSFLSGSDINDTGTTTNYDALLNSFAAQNFLPNVPFGGGTSKYSSAASAARAALVAAGWTITDGGLGP